MTPVNESVIENTALAWLESLDYVAKHGLKIAPGELAVERCGTVGHIEQAGRL